MAAKLAATLLSEGNAEAPTLLSLRGPRAAGRQGALHCCWQTRRVGERIARAARSKGLRPGVTARLTGASCEIEAAACFAASVAARSPQPPFFPRWGPDTSPAQTASKWPALISLGAHAAMWLAHADNLWAVYMDDI
jgi:hypothetical protein